MLKQTVLANDGAIGLSFAGVTDPYKKAANLAAFGNKILVKRADLITIMSLERIK